MRLASVASLLSGNSRTNKSNCCRATRFRSCPVQAASVIEIDDIQIICIRMICNDTLKHVYRPLVVLPLIEIVRCPCHGITHTTALGELLVDFLVISNALSNRDWARDPVVASAIFS